MGDAPDSVTCPTVLLDDLPAAEDAFAASGVVGPHQRVASAIVALVDEPGGKMIGLEGSWGIGKTTVVNFVQHALANETNRQMLVFNAWAHEGDPLRRTFLESLIQQLRRIDWIDSESWKNISESLAKRRRVSKQRTIPKPTLLGKLVAFSLLFVPLGPPFIRAAVEDGITIAWGNPPSWNLIAGLSLSFAPLIAIVLRWVWLRFRIIRVLFAPLFARLWRLVIPNRLRGTAGEIAEQDERKRDSSDEISQFALLLSHSITESKTEVTEEPDPTSIEFERYFFRLMAEALADRDRKLVIVLDNLDRVDPDDALSIWSTLQTFLQNDGTQVEVWSRQLWILVPYDPNGLRRLWSSKSVDRSSDSPRESVVEGPKTGDAHATVQQHTASLPILPQSFIDKSFQIRFEVPPPVLSNWRQFLCDLVGLALPKHSQRDRQLAYQVFNTFRSDGRAPTPRELKLYVNQIGAIHRQWSDEFPIAHIAYYALLRRAGRDVVSGLLDGSIPEPRLQNVMGISVKDDLAGLAFNVPANLGRQLLLESQILNTLERGDTEEFKRIESINPGGFWAVLEQIANTQLPDSDPRTIANTARCLRDSGFIKSHKREELETALNAVIKYSGEINHWGAIDGEIADGIAALCEMKNDIEHSKHLVCSLSDTLQPIDSSDGKPAPIDPAKLISSILLVFKKLDGLGHQEAVDQPLTLPLDVGQWVDAANQLSKEDPSGRHWKKLQPACEFEEISQFLQTSATSDNLNTAHANVVNVLHSTPVKKTWAGFVTAIQDRLNPSDNIGIATAVFNTYMLMELSAKNVNEASAALKKLAGNGHLLHHFNAAKTAAQKSWIGVAFLREQPGVPDPGAGPGNAQTGYTSMGAYLDSEDAEDIKEFSARIIQYRCPNLPFQISDAREQWDKLVEKCIKSFANSDSPQQFFTYGVIRQYWHELPDVLDRGNKDEPVFSKLLSHLVNSTPLTKKISSYQTGFEPDRAAFYRRVIRVAATNEFAIWCKEQLESIGEGTWVSQLNGETQLLDLLLDLKSRGLDIDLKTNFKDALVSHGRSILDGTQKVPTRLNSKWPELIDTVGSMGTRKDLGSRLLDSLIAKSGQFPSNFFDLYGQELFDTEMLLSRPRVISEIFSLIVKNRDVRALEWLLELSNRDRTFLGSYQHEAEVEEFIVRVQETLESPTDDDAQKLIEKIASNFSVEWQKPASEEIEANQQGSEQAGG